MTTVDTSNENEVVHSGLLVTRAAAWMADWGTYVDEPDYQDPEVAVADGYADIPLPPGALSGIALASDRLPPEAVRAGCVQRAWTAVEPVVVGTPLRVRIGAGYGTVATRFETMEGTTVAIEHLSVVDAPVAVEEGGGEPVATFVTGPLDLTRVRALSWSLGELDPHRRWRWGEEPQILRELAQRLVAPALVAARAVVSGKDAARRIGGLTLRCAATPPAPGAALSAHVTERDATTANVVVSAASVLVAVVSLQFRS